MLTFIFVPQEDYFSNQFNEIKTNFTNKLNVDVSDLEQLKNVSEIDLNSIGGFEGILYGKSVKFVDFSVFNQFKNRFHNLARGFIFPLLILYNLNQVYFLIRGVNLFGSSKGDEK